RDDDLIAPVVVQIGDDHAPRLLEPRLEDVRFPRAVAGLLEPIDVGIAVTGDREIDVAVAVDVAVTKNTGRKLRRHGAPRDRDDALRDGMLGPRLRGVRRLVEDEDS